MLFISNDVPVGRNSKKKDAENKSKRRKLGTPTGRAIAIYTAVREKSDILKKMHTHILGLESCDNSVAYIELPRRFKPTTRT